MDVNCQIDPFLKAGQKIKFSSLPCDKPSTSARSDEMSGWLRDCRELMIQSRAGNSSFNRAICLLVRRDCLLISPQIILNNCRSLRCLKMKNGPTDNQPKSIFTNHRNIPYQAIWRHIRTLKWCGKYPGLDYFYSSQLLENIFSELHASGWCWTQQALWCIVHTHTKVWYEE